MIKFLEVKRAYYADPENVVVEYWIGNAWERCDGEPIWSPGLDYRIRPRTIRIGDIDVPEPVRDCLRDGIEYFIVALGSIDLHGRTSWKDDNSDARWLKAGLVHLTKEAAIEHAKALILVSGGKV